MKENEGILISAWLARTDERQSHPTRAQGGMAVEKLCGEDLRHCYGILTATNTEMNMQKGGDSEQCNEEKVEMERRTRSESNGMMPNTTRTATSYRSKQKT